MAKPVYAPVFLFPRAEIIVATHLVATIISARLLADAYGNVQYLRFLQGAPLRGAPCKNRKDYLLERG